MIWNPNGESSAAAAPELAGLRRTIGLAARLLAACHMPPPLD